jgi:hypothetical protein
MEAILNSCLRIILAAPAFTPAECLRWELDLPKMETRLMKRALDWVGRLHEETEARPGSILGRAAAELSDKVAARWVVELGLHWTAGGRPEWRAQVAEGLRRRELALDQEALVTKRTTALFRLIKAEPELDRRWGSSGLDQAEAKMLTHLRAGVAGLAETEGRRVKDRLRRAAKSECCLCHQEDEDTVHFLIRCPVLAEERQRMVDSLPGQLRRRVLTGGLSGQQCAALLLLGKVDGRAAGRTARAAGDQARLAVERFVKEAARHRRATLGLAADGLWGWKPKPKRRRQVD